MQAATVTARMGDFLNRELDLKIDEVHYWSDSVVTLRYIKNTTKRLKTYLANRKQEILDTTSPDQWHHCPTKDNPSDVASREVLGHQLTKTKWFTGPEFLMKNKTEWPGLDEDIRDIDDDDPEVKREQVVASIFQSCEHPIIMDLVEK